MSPPTVCIAQSGRRFVEVLSDIQGDTRQEVGLPGSKLISAVFREKK